MKKIIFMLLMLILPIFSINAASLGVTMSCSKTVVKAGDSVTCTVKATTDDLVGISFKYSLGGMTYSKFATSVNYDTKNTTSSGAVLGNTGGLSSSFTVGTITLKVPSSADAGDTFTFKLTNVTGSTSEWNDISHDSLSHTFRIAATTNTLDSLSLSDCTLSPKFSKDTTTYKCSTENSSVKISASKTCDYSSFVSGYGPRTVSLDYGKNTVKVKVKSESGVTKTYTITVTRIDNRDTVNTLSDLGVTGYELNPTFSSTTNAYKITVPADVKSVKITATKTSDKSTFVSGSGPRTVDLDYGLNAIKIKVKSENEVIRSYTINITREDDRDSINTLNSLSVSGYTLSPAFSKNTTSYTLKVPSDVKKVTIKASKTSDTSKYVSGYGPRTVSLDYGSNTVQVKVTSENQVIKTYTIKITREDSRSKNNYLKTLELSQGNIVFDKTVQNYTFTVNNDVTGLLIKATAEDVKSKVSGAGTKALKVGTNTFTISVKAENGSIRKYVINVTRLDESNIASNNNKLSELSIENYQFEFKADVLKYNITIEDETELNLFYLTEDEGASVIVNGNNDLKDGSVIDIIVTASDGSVREYKINISKNQSGVVNEPIGNPVEGEGLSKKETIIICVSAVVLIILIVIILFVKTVLKVKKKAIEWK